MDATPASRRSVGLHPARRRRSRGLNSDHRGIRRAVIVEFYTTGLGSWTRPVVNLRPITDDLLGLTPHTRRGLTSTGRRCRSVAG